MKIRPFSPLSKIHRPTYHRAIAGFWDETLIASIILLSLFMFLKKIPWVREQLPVIFKGLVGDVIDFLAPFFLGIFVGACGWHLIYRAFQKLASKKKSDGKISTGQ